MGLRRLVCLVLLGLFTWLWRGSVKGLACGLDMRRHTVRQGDTCWDLAERHHMSIAELSQANPEANCANLAVGSQLCVKKV